MNFVSPRPVLGVLFVGTLLTAQQASAQSSDTEAKNLIVKVTNEGIAVLRDKSLTREQRNERLQKIAFDNMDFDTLSRLCMGRHWKNIPQDKRTQFTEEFKKRLTISYSQNLDQYSGQEVVVTGSRREPDGDFTVQSYITDGDKKELAKVNYRIRGKPGQLKVIDFTVEGISLVSNYRAQFQELMSNGGIDNVLQVLRDKNARGEK